MWQTFIFGMHWRRGGKMYYDELRAGSKEEAAEHSSIPRLVRRRTSFVAQYIVEGTVANRDRPANRRFVLGTAEQRNSLLVDPIRPEA
jgi:hypothetical protein